MHTGLAIAPAYDMATEMVFIPNHLLRRTLSATKLLMALLTQAQDYFIQVNQAV
jgi:hypothetical protein